MPDFAPLFIRGSLTDEADGGGEDAGSLLPSLNCARRVRSTITDALDVVQDGRLGRSREEKVAVARVNEKSLWHRLLRGGEALRDDGAAIDAAGAWGMPLGARVCEDVLGAVSVGIGESDELVDLLGPGP